MAANGFCTLQHTIPLTVSTCSNDSAALLLYCHTEYTDRHISIYLNINLFPLLKGAVLCTTSAKLQVVITLSFALISVFHACLTPIKLKHLLTGQVVPAAIQSLPDAMHWFHLLLH
jgi:hypothetical protein